MITSIFNVHWSASSLKSFVDIRNANTTRQCLNFSSCQAASEGIATTGIYAKRSKFEVALRHVFVERYKPHSSEENPKIT
jgi:hypothetical protein